jgi:DNA-binding Lrp family transcriptional regulator
MHKYKKLAFNYNNVYNIVMLDVIGRQVMMELFHDGLCTNNEIARKLGISPQTVAKKVNYLLKSGTISIKAIPDPAKMGNFAASFIGLNVDITKIDNICDSLKKIPNINMIATCFGRYDLLLLVFFRSWESLEYFIKGKLSKLDGIRTFATFEVSNLDGNLEIDLSFSLDTNKPQLSETDRKIILELMKNGRPKYLQLAKKLGVSTATISRRITALIENGYMKIVAVPNHRLDYIANAFILLNAEFSKIKSISEKLTTLPEVQLTMKLRNEYDILFGVNAEDRISLYKFIKNEVARLDGVVKSETFILGDFLYLNINALA